MCLCRRAAYRRASASRPPPPPVHRPSATCVCHAALRHPQEIAATRIQALARGAAKRRFVRDLREHRMRELEDDIALVNDCAQSIQAAWRGYNVRRLLRPVIDARMLEFRSQRAAMTIQRIVRGSTTRHLVAAMVQRRKTVERWMRAALLNMGIDPSLHMAVSAFTDALDVDEEQAAVQARLLHRATVDLLANVTQMDLLLLFSPPDVAPIQLQALAGAVRAPTAPNPVARVL